MCQTLVLRLKCIVLPFTICEREYRETVLILYLLQFNTLLNTSVVSGIWISIDICLDNYSIRPINAYNLNHLALLLTLDPLDMPPFFSPLKCLLHKLLPSSEG